MNVTDTATSCTQTRTNHAKKIVELVKTSKQAWVLPPLFEMVITMMRLSSRADESLKQVGLPITEVRDFSGQLASLFNVDEFRGNQMMLGFRLIAAKNTCVFSSKLASVRNVTFEIELVLAAAKADLWPKELNRCLTVFTR